MTRPSPSICIVYDSDACLEQAKQFAELHSLPLYDNKSEAHDLQLVFTDTRVELYDLSLKTAIHVDFVSGSQSHRQQFGGGRGQALAKAIGLKHGNTPSVLDTTTGLARDAYVLASLGCQLTLIEQSPFLVALIEDGIKRGLQAAESNVVLKKFELYNMNAIDYLHTMADSNRPDVIYIDPMYPERKKSAQVKKDMQILRRLLGKDVNEKELLDTALNSHCKRVVVKRPIHANPVGNLKPHTAIRSKKTRYDIYL